MPDHATPNLPSRDFDATTAFYALLGFEPDYRGPGWMILMRGEIMLEFFPYPDLDPYQSSFGSCLRLDDMHGFHGACLSAGVPVAHKGIPRVTAPSVEASGIEIAYLVDPDGSLLRLIQN